MIHSGSRGLGHQVATDALVQMEKAMGRDGILTNDRQLACATTPCEGHTSLPTHILTPTLTLTPPTRCARIQSDEVAPTCRHGGFANYAKVTAA